MRFEDKLKNEIRRQFKEKSEKFEPYFTQGNQLSDHTKELFRTFINVLDIYNYKKYEDTKSEREIWDIGEEFQNYFTDDNLKELYEK